MNRRLLSAATLGLLMTACSTAPAPAPVKPTTLFDPVAMLKAIRAAGASATPELAVNPLAGTHVTDLQKQARQLHAQARHAEAAVILDQALVIDPGDPELLQQRAEAALLLSDLQDAERFARQAIMIGAEVGPQCRRHWETVVQVLTVAAVATDDSMPGQTAELTEARQQRDGCTVTAPPRY